MNKIIYSLRIMLDLVEAGFIPFTTMPNPKYPQYDCWIFKRSEEFDAALDCILGGLPHEE